MPSESHESLLRMDGVSVAPSPEGSPILSGLALRIERGQSVGIVGESGAGKSILVRTIMGLLPDPLVVTEGSLTFKGEDLRRIDDARFRRLRGREFAHILPNAKNRLNPVFTIGQLMTDVIRAHRTISKGEARERAVAALGQLGIPDPASRVDAYPHELSGGMAQRVCIAMALTHEPDLLVADEPTAGLDVTVQRQVLDHLASLVSDRGTAQIIATRDFGIVAHYCDWVAVMKDGQIVEAGPTQRVFQEPHSAYARDLLAAVRKDTLISGGVQ